MSAFLLLLLWFESAMAFPIGPAQWGDGVPVADHLEGQSSGDLVCAEDRTLIAWQDDRGKDPDLAVQILDSTGHREFGANGRRLRRAGIQTNPVLSRGGLAFRESLDGENWSIVYVDRFASPDEWEIEVSEASGGAAELQSLSLPSGDLITWVQMLGDQRSIQATLIEATQLTSWTICEHDGSLGDVQTMKNHELVFWTWTDWRDAMSPQIYVQALDVASGDLLFETNGLRLTPESEWTWMARPAAGERGYMLIVYLERIEGGTIVRFQKLDALGNFSFWPPRTLSASSPLIGSVDAASNDSVVRVAWNDKNELTSVSLNMDGESMAPAWAQTLPVQRITNVTIGLADAIGWLLWQDDRHGRLFETIVVQALGVDNRPLFTDIGIETSNNGHAKSRPQLTTQPNGSCVVAWEDHASPEENPKILVQRFE